MFLHMDFFFEGIPKCNELMNKDLSSFRDLFGSGLSEEPLISETPSATRTAHRCNLKIIMIIIIIIFSIFILTGALVAVAPHIMIIILCLLTTIVVLSYVFFLGYKAYWG